jgi:hypothetical protein
MGEISRIKIIDWNYDGFPDIYVINGWGYKPVLGTVFINRNGTFPLNSIVDGNYLSFYSQLKLLQDFP